MAEEERKGRSRGGIKSRWRRFRRQLQLSRQYAQEEKEERRARGGIKSRWRRFRRQLQLSRQYAQEEKEEGIPKNDIRSSWRRFRRKLQLSRQYATPKKEPLYISKEIEYFNVTLLSLMGYRTHLRSLLWSKIGKKCRTQVV